MKQFCNNNKYKKTFVIRLFTSVYIFSLRQNKTILLLFCFYSCSVDRKPVCLTPLKYVLLTPSLAFRHWLAKLTAVFVFIHCPLAVRDHNYIGLLVALFWRRYRKYYYAIVSSLMIMAVYLLSVAARGRKKLVMCQYCCFYDINENNVKKINKLQTIYMPNYITHWDK